MENYVTSSSTQHSPGPPSTRERIVGVAIDLFARQGYGGTSLRNIAEELGITKAAVYHHFHTKEDIAHAVISRALDAQQAMADRLIVAGTDPSAWERALPRVIDIALAERQLLSALERDEDTYAALFAGDPTIGPRLSDPSASFRSLLANPDIDTAVRVRLGCVLGALMGPLVFLADHYHDITGDELRHHLGQAITILLRELPAIAHTNTAD